MDIKYDEKSCGVVLFSKKNGKTIFLLLHYPGGHWDFVKGHVDEGEEETATALRELWEETGITQATFIAEFREQISYSYKRSGRLSRKEVVFFLAETDQTEVTLSHEHKGFKWLPYDEAKKLLTFDNAINLLDKAKNILDQEN